MATQFSHLLSAVRANGVTLAGGKVYFYEPATLTPKTVWLDNRETTEAANPYTLDANGTAKIFGFGLYRVIVKDSKGVTQFDWDNISSNFYDDITVLTDSDQTITGSKTFTKDVSAPNILKNTTDIAAHKVTLDSHSATLATQAPIISTLTSQVESLSTAQEGGMVGYATRAELLADLDHDAGTVGFVGNDPDPDYIGNYRKEGVSGAGTWVQSSWDRVTRLQTGPIADVSDKIGGTRERDNLVYGNPIVTGAATPAGSVWVGLTPFVYGGNLTKIEAYVQTAGDGVGSFLVLTPSGSDWKIKAIIPVTGAIVGAMTLDAGIDFTATAVAAGDVLGFYATGGMAIAYTAGTGDSLQATVASVAAGDVLTMTQGTILFSLRATVSTMRKIVDNRLTSVEGATANIRAAMQRNIAPAVTSGATDSNVVDGFFNLIYTSEPAFGDGYLSDFKLRFSRSGSGEVHVLRPNAAGSYTNVGVYPVAVEAGVFSVASQIPTPMWVTKGTRFAYKPVTGVAPRFAGGGPTYTAVSDTGLGATVTLHYENVTSAMSLSVAPIAPVTSLIENQRFTGTASAEWTLNGWTWGPNGLTGPATLGWAKSAYLNHFTSASKRGLRARFTVSDPSAKFGLSYDPSINVAYGSAAIVDGSTSQLQLYYLNGAGVATLSKEVDIPWAIPASVDLQWDRSGMAQTITLTDPDTQQTVTLTQALGDAGVVNNASYNYGRPGLVQISGTVGSIVCTSFQLCRRVPRNLHAIVFGDSIAMGNAYGGQWATAWPYLLDEARGKNDVLNCSIGGGTTTELATRLGIALGSASGDIDLSFYQPTYAVIALGVNDGTLDTWRANMAGIIKAVLAKGAIPILATVTPFAAKQSLIDQMNADIMGGYFGTYDYIDFAASVSVDGDRVTVDSTLYLATENPNYLHPNEAGQSRMYQQIRIDAPWLIQDPAE